MEMFDGHAILKLPVLGFEKLPLKEKLVAYHLCQAAIAGRDITFDQNHRHALRIRKWCEEILLHPRGINPPVLSDVAHYLILQFVHCGVHGKLTFAKFTPPATLTFEKFRQAAEMAVKNGADMNLAELSELRRTMFDPHFEQFCTSRSPGPGEDLLTVSANNYYERGLRMKDLEGFNEKYPLNSTVVRKDGELQEVVWRAGDAGKGIPGGLYSEMLSRVVRHLEEAKKYATPEHARALGLLIEFYRTGDNGTFREFNIAWLAFNKPIVDQINGFIEEYRDPREKKGSWEGNVFFIDDTASHWLREIAAKADYYESKTPFDEAYKRKGAKPVANFVEVLIETGDAGPISWSGVNLPNDQSVRQEYGSKNVLLWNARRAKEAACGEALVREFIWPGDQALVIKHANAAAEVLVGFHEALGHASGQKSSAMKGEPRDHLPGYYSWIEEERADLVALHHAWDPETFKIHPHWTEDAAKALYKRYPMMELLNLAEVPENATSIEEPHAVGGNFAVKYFMKKWKVVEEVQENVNGKQKTFWRVRDENIPKMREAVAELLKELQRIKSEGDLAAIKKLAEEYGATSFSPAIAKEIRERKKALQIPSFFAYVFPELELRGPANDPTDVVLRNPKSFLHQQMKWSGYTDEELHHLPHGIPLGNVG